MSAVAKRYAQSLVSLAQEETCLEPVEADLYGLSALLDSSDDFRNFVAHPLISEEEQSAALDALFKANSHQLTQNLLQLLVQRERLAELPQIVSMALEQIREVKGELVVDVLTAEPMPKGQEDALRNKLAKRMGKTIELRIEVDATLLGGFRLQYGDQVEDYSLATKLETFKQNIINA